ncbi:hypothetical protein B7P43_G01810 [Cryptotermes secundus]|uniref:Ionotropic glutamate receptor C-terminal domain-containing protein n=1 Tax=Cryptotermes secundus TaxID=105785 RepID=A0A2J7QJZ9_9NEOP|nr:hypothetical protein B7P43_G01810 [Cryptotermes secundus]
MSYVLILSVFHLQAMVFLINMLSVLHTLLTTTSHDLVSADQRHLVMCVKTILLRHFVSGESLLVSLPSDGYNVTSQEADHLMLMEVMVQNINEEILWPLEIYKPRIQRKQSFLGRQGYPNVFIMFTWFEQEERNIIINLTPQLENLITKGLLNSHARFIIIITDNVVAPGQTALSTVEYLWANFKIFDVLVLCPIINSDLNRSNGMARFHFYSWFPFHSYGQQEILFDECILGKNNQWYSETNLFPSKIPSKFQNYNAITVFTGEVKPSLLLTKNYTEGNRTVLEFRGPEIDMLNLILGTINISFTYSNLRRGNTTDFLTLMAELSSGRLDLMIGALPLHESLTAYGDPSFPYYFTGYKWYVPCPKAVPRVDKISGIFYPSAWLSLVVSFVTMSLVMWGYGSLFKESECHAYETLSNCFYNVWAVAFGVSVHHKPIISELKAIFLLWVCYCYAMNTVFQTFFTSFLVDPGFENPIKDYDELLASGLDFGYGSGSESLFFENYSEFNSKETSFRRSRCLSYEECFLRIFKDRHFATLQVEFFANAFTTVYLPRNEHLLCSLNDYYRIIYVVMYLPKGSHILNPLNRVASRIAESGLFSKWISGLEEFWKIKGVSMLKVDVLTKHSSVDGYFVFNMSHLQIAFCSLAIGLVLSFAVLFAEMLNYSFGCN